jgi:y4mF family transcriptional regulator
LGREANFIPDREYFGTSLDFIPDREYLIFLSLNLPIGKMSPITTPQEYGALIRQKRKALGLTQDELAARCGVGVRFIVDLESGKPSCQLGKALTAAAEVGLWLEDVPASVGQTLSPPDENDPLSKIPTFR